MRDVALRPYRRRDLPRCLALFDTNVPTFFDADERDDFAGFLRTAGRRDTPYLVLEVAGSTVACGGLVLDADGRGARLAWGMVDGAHHGRGLGARLTRARLDLALANPRLVELRLDTSRHTRGFYERFGFEVRRIEPDGFAPGLDRHEMTAGLAAVRRARGP